MLGRRPDAWIARKLGIAASTVAAERLRRGIPPHRAASRFEWTRRALSLLGTASDAEIGRRLGISEARVRRRRVRLGIEAAFADRARRPAPREDPFWTLARQALLGTASDATIARRLHITHRRVRHRRERLGIPAAKPRPRHDWPKVDPLLGKSPDAAVAARCGMHEETVRRRRRKLRLPAFQAERRAVRRDGALARLLRRPTAEITEMTDLSSSAVQILRQQLGVRPPPRRSRWTPRLVRRLGREPDEAIARELGISITAVRFKRYRLGIKLRPWRAWTAEDDAVLAETRDNREAARRLGRTVKAVIHRRANLAGAARGG